MITFLNISLIAWFQSRGGANGTPEWYDLRIYVQPKDESYLMERLINLHLIDENKKDTIGKVVERIELSTSGDQDKVVTSERAFRYVHETELYLTFKHLISNHLKCSKALDKPNALALNLNGPPGTGKTTFIDYIGKQNLVSYVVRINTMKFTKIPFKTIIDKINKMNYSNRDSILIVFDEIDKYLASYVTELVRKKEKALLEEYSTMNNNSHTEHSNDNAKMKEHYPSPLDFLARSSEPVKRSLSDKEKENLRIRAKEKFCQELQLLLDGEKIEFKRVIVLFNTNNFETIFEDTGRHYEAVSHRFAKIKFQRLNREEVIRFIKMTFDRLVSCEVEITNENSDIKKSWQQDYSLLAKIPADISISTRLLGQLMVISSYNLEKLVKNLNDNKFISSIENNITFHDTDDQFSFNASGSDDFSENQEDPEPAELPEDQEEQLHEQVND